MKIKLKEFMWIDGIPHDISFYYLLMGIPLDTIQTCYWALEFESNNFRFNFKNNSTKTFLKVLFHRI